MKKEEVERLFKEYYPEMYRRAITILYDRQESDDQAIIVFLPISTSILRQVTNGIEGTTQKSRPDMDAHGIWTLSCRGRG